MPLYTLTTQAGVLSGETAITNAGTFEIAESSDTLAASITNTGGTVQVDAGDSLTLSGAAIGSSAVASSGGTVTIAGHGEDSRSDAKLASVTIEATLTGRGQWQPICEPITPDSTGAFSCEWNTASGQYPNGEYELRAKLTDSSSCPKSAFTKPIISKVTNTQLLLEPRSAGPRRMG